MFLHVSVILFTGGWWYPSMHCRWYPSMPCRFPGPHPGGGSPGPHPTGPHPGRCIPACTEAEPPDGYCCGRHASYWNAFLLRFICTKRKRTRKRICFFHLCRCSTRTRKWKMDYLWTHLEAMWLHTNINELLTKSMLLAECFQNLHALHNCFMSVTPFAF